MSSSKNALTAEPIGILALVPVVKAAHTGREIAPLVQVLGVGVVHDERQLSLLQNFEV